MKKFLCSLAFFVSKFLAGSLATLVLAVICAQGVGFVFVGHERIQAWPYRHVKVCPVAWLAPIHLALEPQRQLIRVCFSLLGRMEPGVIRRSCRPHVVDVDVQVMIQRFTL